VTSSIVLNFSRPVSAVSAAQLHVTLAGQQIPGSILTQDSSVIFTPTVPMPGAATIVVSGLAADLAGLQADVRLWFTTGSNPDATPPTLVFTYPPDGARVPAGSTNLVLRFSEPVTVAYNAVPVQILSGASPISTYNLLTFGEDSQTLAGSFSLPADTDVTVAVTADLRDFNGNPIQPVSFRFRTESYVESQGPQVTAVSPADGAVNVDVNSPIELHFSQPMEPVSVSSGLQVTNAGRTVTGQVGPDESAQILTFRPDVPYLSANTVELFAGQSIYDVSGRRIGGAFYSHFTTLGPSPTGQAVSFSVAADAIDVRFAGPVPATVDQVYLRQGANLVPTRVEVAAPDQIRVIPAAALAEGVPYHLVLDSTQEVLIEVEKETDDPAGEVAVHQMPGAVRIRFARPVNPLTILRGGIRLLRSDGTPVNFTVQAGLDRREMTLVPATSAGPLTVLLDGVESRSGSRLPTMVRRP
jgi:methionine-rich copper-binding protein CopC